MQRTRYPLHVAGADEARASRAAACSTSSPSTCCRAWRSCPRPAVVVAAGSTGCRQVDPGELAARRRRSVDGRRAAADHPPPGARPPPGRRRPPARTTPCWPWSTSSRTSGCRAASRCWTRRTSTRSSRPTARRRTGCSRRPTCGCSSRRPRGTATRCRGGARRCAERRASVAMVLNRVPPDALTTVRGDLLAPPAGARDGRGAALRRARRRVRTRACSTRPPSPPSPRWLTTLAGAGPGARGHRPDPARVARLAAGVGRRPGRRRPVPGRRRGALRIEVATAIAAPTSAAAAAVDGRRRGRRHRPGGLGRAHRRRDRCRGSWAAPGGCAGPGAPRAAASGAARPRRAPARVRGRARRGRGRSGRGRAARAARRARRPGRRRRPGAGWPSPEHVRPAPGGRGPRGGRAGSRRGRAGVARLVGTARRGDAPAARRRRGRARRAGPRRRSRSRPPPASRPRGGPARRRRSAPTRRRSSTRCAPGS